MEDNQYICADAFEYLKQIPDKSVNLFFTDPPYKIIWTKGGGYSARYHGLNESIKKLTNAGLHKSYDIAEMANEVKRLQPYINAYFWCNKAQMMEYLNVYVNGMRCNFHLLTWHKTDIQGLFRGKYNTDTEYLLHFFKGKGTTWPQCYDDARTWVTSKSTKGLNRRWGHPTIKPMDFTRKVIRNSSRPGDTVLDPFMGSGTTGIASLIEGRRFIGIENNEKFFDIAVRRFNEEAEKLRK